MAVAEIRQREVLNAVLLRTLAAAPAGMKSAKHPERQFTLSDREREIATPKPRKARSRKRASGVGSKAELPDRERLVAALLQIANALSLSDLDMLVDLARVVRRRDL